MRKALGKLLVILTILALVLLVVQLAFPATHIWDAMGQVLKGLWMALDNLLSGHVSVK